MEFTPDVASGDWLLARVGAWGSVGGIAGTGFPAYARVLHPVTAVLEDRTAIDEYGDHPGLQATTWRWADVAARRGIAMRPLVTWSEVSGRDDETDVAFDDGWRVSPPEEGWFDPPQLAALMGHLAQATSTPAALVAGLWSGWVGHSTLGMGWQGDGPVSDAERAAALAEFARLRDEHVERERALLASIAGPRLPWPDRPLILFRTDAAELADPEWPSTGSNGDSVWSGHTPQLLWPEDHAWVLASEIDLDSTIVGGPRGLVDAVLHDDRFESYQVAEDSTFG